MSITRSQVQKIAMILEGIDPAGLQRFSTSWEDEDTKQNHTIEMSLHTGTGVLKAVSHKVNGRKPNPANPKHDILEGDAYHEAMKHLAHQIINAAPGTRIRWDSETMDERIAQTPTDPTDPSGSENYGNYGGGSLSELLGHESEPFPKGSGRSGLARALVEAGAKFGKHTRNPQAGESNVPEGTRHFTTPLTPSKINADDPEDKGYVTGAGFGGRGRGRRRRR